ncbi:MAG: hypothetical protein AAGC55_18910, partial [Myxococcota bacterium]
AGDGALWVVAEGRLHRRDSAGGWTIYELPAPALAVYANPRASHVWIRSEAELLVFNDGVFSRVDSMAAGATPWDVDDIGRLLISDGSGLQRVSLGRPVAVLGIPDSGVIFAPTKLVFAPTDADSVVDLQVTLGGTALALEAGPWRTVVDPLQLDAGTYDLAIDVSYQDEVARGDRQFIVTSPTWEGDIAPLYEQHCARCHAGDTGAVALDSYESWQVRFADIVERVERNNMPLGQEPLGDLDKVTIQAWGAKGFPR